MQVFRIAQALRATVGTQDFTDAGIPTLASGNIKAAWIKASYATVSGSDNASTHAVLAFGMYDGTTQIGMSVRAQDGSTPSFNVLTAAGLNMLNMLGDTGGSTVIVAAASFIDNGMRLTVSATNGRQVLIEVFIATGADYDATLLLTDLTTDPGPLEETLTPGYQADMIQSFGWGTVAGGASICLGAWSRHASRQVCHFWSQQIAGAATAMTAKASQGHIFETARVGVAQARLSIGNVTDTGFDVTATSHANATCYLLVEKLPADMAGWCGLLSPRDTVGAWKVADPLLEPIAGELFTGRVTAINELQSDARAGCFGVGTFLGAGDESFCGIQSEVGVAAVDSQSVTTAGTGVDQPEHDGTQDLEHVIGPFVFGPTGWTATAGAVDASAPVWASWAVGTPSVPPKGALRAGGGSVGVAASGSGVESFSRGEGAAAQAGGGGVGLSSGGGSPKIAAGGG